MLSFQPGTILFVGAVRYLPCAGAPVGEGGGDDEAARILALRRRTGYAPNAQSGHGVHGVFARLPCTRGPARRRSCAAPPPGSPRADLAPGSDRAAHPSPRRRATKFMPLARLFPVWRGLVGCRIPRAKCTPGEFVWWGARWEPRAGRQPVITR
jgi:hypothetical protein